ncbi:vWA domain-containing protein [Herbaspirillum huttiense]|uniref:VWA domain-containing protein n=2 Tax=Herbaspirillum huttiense TaxID=863372 RepID=A0AAJ2HA81_9BURK|nr:VWA domain-containing protein [Herbaspirillum huttiense]MDR9838388.1 VWA domain-containing protein [Herbaspirillum huttiense]
MAEDYLLRQEELVENPTARIPICIVLDTSGSMAGEPIAELQSGVTTFFDAIRADEVAQYSAEVCIVTFGGNVTKNVDFASINRQEIPRFGATGATPMGDAINLALDLLDARKTEYRNAGVDYFQPWMVLMTDGQPTDSIDLAANRIRELVGAKKLTVFPIGIGSDADMNELARLSPGRPPLRLQGLNFREFFLWLSKSVSRVSQSTPGESVPLDVAGINAWAKV